MRKPKKDLADKVTSVCKKADFIKNQKLNKETCTQLYVSYGIPMSITSDILLLKKDPIDEDVKILYCILKEIEPKAIEDYFTDGEIKRYDTYEHSDGVMVDKITLRCIQIAPFQWMGNISARELFNLNRKGIVHYNENTQRTMTRRVYKGKDGTEDEYYQITLNRKSVNSIMRLMDENVYVPDTITLNVPEVAEISYDDSFGNISISDFEHLDIIDGYHRFVAICNECLKDETFDYNMEIRIVQFTEEKANQFIWQNDQKNKMNKIDTKLMNQTAPANQVIQMLNQSPVLFGMIGRNGAKIDGGAMASMIDAIFFNERIEYKRKDIVGIKDKIQNYFTSYYDSDIKHGNAYIFALLYLCSIGIRDDVFAQSLDPEIYEKRSFTKRDVTRMANDYTEWEAR